MERVEAKVDLALVHYPVNNRHGECIGSAVTNLDIHDIARAACTYGAGTYWLITPYTEQQRLAAQIIDHWVGGYGSQSNPDRGQALSLIRVADTLETVIEQATETRGERPLVVATSARAGEHDLGFGQLREAIEKGRAILLVFGTAWGLAREVLAAADHTLEPLQGSSAFNHLSVRSAASIILDRLLATQRS